MSFKGLDDAGVPEPLFCDLAFSKSCIAVNGRKAVLGCKSGLFLFDGKSGLLPISIEKEEMSYALYIILSIAVLLSAFLALFLLKRRKRERYFITILLMIEDIDAAIISRVLDVDQATVTRHKYNVRKEIEQLYPDGEFDCKVINLLYDRISSRRK